MDRCREQGMTINSHADKENGMTAPLVEMKVETKKKSIRNKRAEFHILKEKRGSSAWWNGVERLFACLKYTRNFISLSLGESCTTHHDYGTHGKCSVNESKNWGKKFEAQSTTTFIPIRHFGMIGVVVRLADGCIGNVHNAAIR